MIAENIVHSCPHSQLMKVCEDSCTRQYADFLDKLYTTYVFSDGSTITLSEDGLKGASF